MQLGSQSTNLNDCERDLNLGSDEGPSLDDSGYLSDALYDATG